LQRFGGRLLQFLKELQGLLSFFLIQDADSKSRVEHHIIADAHVRGKDHTDAPTNPAEINLCLSAVNGYNLYWNC
jgi:hypothetical protein